MYSRGVTQPVRDEYAPNDATVIQVLMQELNSVNDQRLYLKAQVVELKTRLKEVLASQVDTVKEMPVQPKK